MFPIKILATDKSLVPTIRSAIQLLNQVQNEFKYDLANDRLLEMAYYFDKEEFTLNEVFNWLRQFRAETGGNQPFIILVTTRYLSGQLSNLFGSHVAAEGLAVFTTDAFDPKFKQFLFDKIRFCRYYLVRYSLSFVAPTIRSHKSAGCMFDNKIDKRDILLSLATGRVCPECNQTLKASPSCNIEVERSLKKLLDLVSNQYPRALILKGGGVKGLALVGALKELESYFIFDTFAGTSAGAIAATLLGAGYTPSELEFELQKKDFKDFKDNLFRVSWNLLSRFALHSGNPIERWLNRLLINRINNQVSEIKMRDLPQRTVIYASRIDTLLTFDSEGEFRDEGAAFATRCSMTIPFFFVPKKVSDYKVYDGGLGNNFPLQKFTNDNNHIPFIGLYLKSEVKKKGSLLNNLMDIATDMDERKIVDNNLDKIVIIDPSPVKTKQFSLTKREKEFLVLAGRVGALKYLSNHHPDFQISTDELLKLQEKLDAERAYLNSSWRSRMKQRRQKKKSKES